MDNLIAKLYQTSKTILTTQDLVIIWQESNPDSIKSKISYYVKKGLLLRLTRGIFAKNKDYDPKELADSVYTPSYISFETVLRENGIIFQNYETIFVASRFSQTKKIDRYSICFRKIKDSLLYNPSGIIFKDNFSIASAERAFLDMLYLCPNYYFDNLKNIDWQKCFEFVKIYNNKQLVKRLKKYYKLYAQS